MTIQPAGPDPGTAHPALPAHVIRPLTPADETLYPAFLARVSADDRRRRFFSPARLSPRLIQGLTRFDPGSAVAFAAIAAPSGELLGVGRLHRLAGREGEFAVLVRSDLKGRGLGRNLLERVLRDASTIGVSRVLGLVLRDNTGMLALAEELGFSVERDPDDSGLVRAVLDLDATC